MPIQFQWQPSVSASLLHMTSMWRAGRPFVDPRIFNTLDDLLPQQDALLSDALLSVADPAQLWQSFVQNGLEIPDEWQPLAKDLLARLESSLPALADQLENRVRPLREAWESRGPGLINRLQALTGGQPITADIKVLLVQPIVGGYGVSLTDNTILLEAVLVNPHRQLPEIARLAWLCVSCSEAEHRGRITTIPAILQAAADVDLVTFDRDTVELALRAWTDRRDQLPHIADELWHWWHTGRDRPPPATTSSSDSG